MVASPVLRTAIGNRWHYIYISWLAGPHQLIWEDGKAKLFIIRWSPLFMVSGCQVASNRNQIQVLLNNGNRRPGVGLSSSTAGIRYSNYTTRMTVFQFLLFALLVLLSSGLVALAGKPFLCSGSWKLCAHILHCTVQQPQQEESCPFLVVPAKISELTFIGPTWTMSRGMEYAN